jgi:hypothetical protein
MAELEGETIHTYNLNKVIPGEVIGNSGRFNKQIRLNGNDGDDVYCVNRPKQRYCERICVDLESATKCTDTFMLRDGERERKAITYLFSTLCQGTERRSAF